MKMFEFKQIIKEEIKKILKEGSVKSSIRNNTIMINGIDKRYGDLIATNLLYIILETEYMSVFKNNKINVKIDIQ